MYSWCSEKLQEFTSKSVFMARSSPQKCIPGQEYTYFNIKSVFLPMITPLIIINKMAETNEIFNEDELDENEETKFPEEGTRYPCRYCTKTYATP